MYRTLDANHIIATCGTLANRIEERFPKSGLASIARELVDAGRDAVTLVRWLRRPIGWVRGLVAGAVLAIVLAATVLLTSIDHRASAFNNWSDLFQGFDALVNLLVLLGGTVFFLSSLERRLKRRSALAALHGLRSLTHIVDMHQLTKDPERLATGHLRTSSSPKRAMTKFELTRYLDYCSELASLISKIAALHAQHFDDPTTLAAVNEVEDLCGALSRKVWQKIMIIDIVAARS